VHAVEPTGEREIVDEKLAFDVAAHAGTASIAFGPGGPAWLDVGDLTIDRVSVPFTARGNRIELSVHGDKRVDIAFHWHDHEQFDGASANGYTFVWPYYCGNLFPCHSNPADGAAFSVEVTGVARGKTAVYAMSIAEAPAYQVAWAIDAYTELPLGATRAGTQLAVWYRPGERETAQAGTAHLRAAFDWLETTLGRYRFGAKAGSVSVSWPEGALGGMEHHPRWHVASAILGDPLAHVHEAAHGWFGDGVRIACWEDFVLSEGTVSYLAARALEVVAPDVGAAAWAKYQAEAAMLSEGALVWPRSCGRVDILKDHLFNNAPYSRGALFYRAIAHHVGADALDRVLAKFYAEHAGKPARMADMLDAIRAAGFDPAACARAWLEDTAVPADC
jgi:Peptidase family M1 domain